MAEHDALLKLLAQDGGLVDITAWGTRARREGGLGFIPEDRHRQGMLLEATLWENRVLGHQTRPPSARGVFIDLSGLVWFVAPSTTVTVFGSYWVTAEVAKPFCVPPKTTK